MKKKMYTYLTIYMMHLCTIIPTKMNSNDKHKLVILNSFGMNNMSPKEFYDIFLTA